MTPVRAGRRSTRRSRSSRASRPRRTPATSQADLALLAADQRQGPAHQPFPARQVGSSAALRRRAGGRGPRRPPTGSGRGGAAARPTRAMPKSSTRRSCSADDLRVELPEETAVELRLLVGHRTTLVKKATARTAQLRDLRMWGTRPHTSQRSGDPPVDRARHRHTPLPQQREPPALVTPPTYQPGPSPPLPLPTPRPHTPDAVAVPGGGGGPNHAGSGHCGSVWPRDEWGLGRTVGTVTTEASLVRRRCTGQRPATASSYWMWTESRSPVNQMFLTICPCGSNRTVTSTWSSGQLCLTAKTRTAMEVHDPPGRLSLT